MKMYIVTIIPKGANEHAIISGEMRKNDPKNKDILSTKHRITGQKAQAFSSEKLAQEWADKNSKSDDIVTIRPWKAVKTK